MICIHGFGYFYAVMKGGESVKLNGSIFISIALIMFFVVIENTWAEQQNVIPLQQEKLIPPINQPITNIGIMGTGNTLKPVDITTEKLTITGKAFTPVDITTEKLTITGKTFTPIDITTEKLTISGKIFTPVDITTEKLTITGKVFTPVDITTEKLTITGKVSIPVNINKDIPSVSGQGGTINKNIQKRGVR
jgi:cytoskeletal protein CcmA (bactofilin family)